MSPAAQFENYRPLMFSIAYRMLGSAADAEDIVQDAYLRYQAVPPETIVSPKAFLGTIVTRLSLTRLQSAHAQRETYIGPWLPEPVLTERDSRLIPTEQINLDDSLSMAFMVLLEELTPLERAVFLLREVFDYEYVEIAEMVGKEETACRQLLSRAKKHIAAHRPRFKPDREEHRRLLDRFMQVVQTGEMDGLMQLLADDVTLWADGGGKARGAALHPLHGREVVARFVVASTHFIAGDYHVELADINGEPAVVLRVGDEARVVLFITVARGRLQEIRAIGNPDKLKHV
jgi:RNA polymerase sigma-70 factor (ECF subfamily)